MGERTVHVPSKHLPRGCLVEDAASGQNSGYAEEANIVIYGSLLQYSCLENPVDGGAWQAKVHRITESQTRLRRLSTHACELPTYGKFFGVCTLINVTANQGCSPLNDPLGSCLGCLLSSGNTGLPWIHFAHFCDSALPGQLVLVTLQNDQELLAQLHSLSLF